MTDELAPRPWRVGRHIGKNLYDANDVDLGRMDTPELAALVVSEVNAASHGKTLVAMAVAPLEAFQQLLHDGAVGHHRGPLSRAVDGWFERHRAFVSPDSDPRPTELLLADVAQIAFTEAADPAIALERIRRLLSDKAST